MRLDFAPMEGITGAVFRRLHHACFSGVDRYYTPFLSPTSDRRFTPREQREFYPEYNEGIPLIPQILTKHAGDFLWAAEELSAMGYKEVNLNAGCPSGTVTAKGKGAGLLADLAALDAFLDEIFTHANCKISVKTRLGLNDLEEFEPILEIYNRYPLSELIVHPRVRKDFYRHPVRTEYFDLAYEKSKNPISYNGSIVTKADFENCRKKYPKLTAIMIGQGLCSNPFLSETVKFCEKTEKNRLKLFHDALFSAYSDLFQSKNNAAQRMKELWFYWFRLFSDSQKLGKQLMKSRNAEEYLAAVTAIFQNLELLPESTGDW